MKLRVALTALISLLAVAALATQLARGGGHRAVACAAEREGAEAARCESLADMGRALQEPADALLARDETGSDPNANFADLFEQAAARSASIGRTTARVDPAAPGAAWQFQGPSSIGGRVLDIAVDPAQQDTIYIATATGGVWKSTDAGSTFQPAWPDNLTLAIGALAITPSGVLYAGTGEAGPGGGPVPHRRQGPDPPPPPPP